MFILHFLWAVFGHLSIILSLIGLGLVLAAYTYVKGIPALLSVLKLPLFWFVLVFAVMSLSILTLKGENDSLRQDLATATAKQTAVAAQDSAATTQQRAKQQTTRKAEAAKVQGALTNAPAGKAEDAVLDAISQVRTGHTAGGR